MKVINTTGNTIHVEDIGLVIPFDGKQPFDVPTETLKQSKTLRNLIISQTIDVAEYNSDERIEASVMFLRGKSKPDEIDKVKEDESEPETTIQPAAELTIKYHGAFEDAGGYAKVNRNVVRELHRRGAILRVEAKQSVSQLEPEEVSDILVLTGVKVRGYIQIDSVIPSLSEVKRTNAKYNILYTTIEGYTIPEQFVECARRYDEVWLTSQWSADVLRRYLPKHKILSMPPGVNEKLYVPEGPRFDFRPNTKSFIFLSLFRWNYRKGWDALLRAYFDEFDREEDVSLLIASRYQFGTTKENKGKIKEDIDTIIAEFPNKDLPHMVRYSQVVPEGQLPQLYRAAHCFVLPSRGESICLPPMEASLCGLPVIATNWSGQTEYLKMDNSYLVDIDHLVKVQRGQMHMHYWDGHEFPSLKDPSFHNRLRKAMREVYTNYQEAIDRNSRLQQSIRSSFTWEKSVDRILTRLNEIWADLKKE